VTARGRRAWRPNRTLRGQLTIGLVAILLIACALLGLTTALALRSFLLQRLDEQLASAGGRYAASLEHGAGSVNGLDTDADNAVPGQAAGTLGVRLKAGLITDAAVVTDQGANKELTFTNSQAQELKKLAINGGPISRDLGALGDYRLRAVAGQDGDVQITGLPLFPVNATLARLLAVEVAAFAVIVIGGGVATTLVVRRTLRPLREVASTALHVSELPLADAGTELPASIGPDDPISEVDQVSVAFDHMLQHVRSALAQRDATEARLRRFVADASHELRTPLATIRAYSEYATRSLDEPLPEATADALVRIRLAADRMGSLVEDLLLLAKLDAGRPLAAEPVDLTRLLLDTVTDARAAHPTHQWRLDLPQQELTVVGDEHRLHQVLANLLSNAATHTPSGTTVTAALQSDITIGTDAAPLVEITVHDDGPGIPAAQQADLFDRFTRGDSSRARDHGSSGLGLAIAAGIAEAHDGTLTVTSEEGAGSTFRLRLPAASPGTVVPD
jgi:two-component system OmpR family sensor kinase